MPEHAAPAGERPGHPAHPRTDEFFRAAANRRMFEDIACRAIGRRFSPRDLRAKLGRYVLKEHLLPADANPGDHAANVRAVLPVLMTIILERDADRLEAGLEEAMYEGLSGRPLLDFLPRIIEEGGFLLLLVSEVEEATRNTEYRSLRQALSRSDGFRLAENGRFFAPADAPDGIPILPAEWEYFDDLPSPGPVKKTRRSADGPEIVWDYAATRREALRFWEAFVDRRCDGMPRILPIRLLFLWLAGGNDLRMRGDGWTLSLDRPAGEAGEAPPAGGAVSVRGLDGDLQESPEDILIREEIAKPAGEFAAGLRPDLGVIGAMDGATLEEIAAAIGRSVSAARGRREKFTAELWSFMTRQEDLDSTALRLEFAEQVIRECRKRFPVPERMAGGSAR